MDEVSAMITIKTLLAFFGGATCIVGGISAIARLFDPIKKMAEELERHEQYLENDFLRLKNMDEFIEEVRMSNATVCKSLLVLLNHEITGNGIDKLKEQRDKLEEYLVNK